MDKSLFEIVFLRFSIISPALLSEEECRALQPAGSALAVQLLNITPQNFHEFINPQISPWQPWKGHKVPELYLEGRVCAIFAFTKVQNSHILGPSCLFHLSVQAMTVLCSLRVISELLIPFILFLRGFKVLF